MTLYKWSQTASADATADSTINWAEGQSPSSVNDSGRAMMAATAKYRDDISGAIVTGGTSTAYTVFSYQVFDSLAHLNGQMIAFTPHVTNGAGPVTLEVDGLGAKSLRSAPNADLVVGLLIQGTPYTAVYNHADGAFYLQGFFGASPYLIPLGAGIDYWGSTAPNSYFAFPFGQAISRTIYSALFALIGTTYGSGDGTATFNLPDKRGRVSAGVDNMGGSAANRLSTTTVSATTVGGTGGAETHILMTDEIPSHTHANTLNDPSHTHNFVQSGSNTITNTWNAGGGTQLGGGGSSSAISLTIASTQTGITLTNASEGGGDAHTNLQPTILCNYIIRIV